MASTRAFTTALVFAFVLLAVHVTIAQAASSGASRKLRGTMATIAGCSAYSGPVGSARKCTACTGGLVPGPIGDRCVSRSAATVKGRR